MSIRNKIALALLTAMALAAVPAQAQTRAPYPIAYVSVQRILNEAEDAKEAAKQLDALRQTKAKELATKKQALDATKLQIANAGGYFSSSRRAQLTELGKKQEAELQQATLQAQTEFTEQQKKVQESLRGELNAILLAIAKERGYLYVLNQDAAVLLGPSGTDLTKDVLDRLNASTAERAAAAAAKK